MYTGGSPAALEDCHLGFQISASSGVMLSPINEPGCAISPQVDSVDADDGVIDGSGLNGRSWFASTGTVTFSFSQPVVAAGVVWTDGFANTVFEAFGPGMVSLGTIGPVTIADGSFAGTTAEDHFFGAVEPNEGIVAIRISNAGGGIEVDHVQLGPGFPAVPALAPPAGALLALLLVLVALALRARAARSH